MTFISASRRTSSALVLIAAAAAAASFVAVPGTSAASVSSAKAVAKPTTAKWTKASLLKPAKKYYGVSVAGAPGTLSGVIPTKSGVANVTTEVGKQPNLLMFYEAWNGGSEGTSAKANLDVNGITNACNAGLLPMLTWESWNTSAKISSNPGVAYTQPAFKMSNIVAGDYDTYIKATAKEIAALNCPVMLRFDQEQNGYWYPWGLTNSNENGSNYNATAAEYVKMWDHVWNVFNAAGANKNVIWTWSPNWQPAVHPHLPNLQLSYPGASKVDLIAIDSYYNKSGLGFADIFDPTIKQLAPFASSVPWIVGETGVGDFSDKPTMIGNLLHQVLVRPRFIGFVYFDQHKSTDRSYWPFQETSASLQAFKSGIASSGYAAGKAGSF